MSIQGILQQLLQSAQGMARGAGTDSGQKNSNSSPMQGFAGGALTGGALALLLGNKKFRKLGGNVAAYGGMAALGAVAYRAYGEWQKNQGTSQAESPVASSQAFAQLPAPEVERQSRMVVAAMISAAKADGHIGAEEQRLLDSEFQKFQGTAADQQWLSTQLTGPADPAGIAQLAAGPEEGAEVYLASVLVTGADSFMERAYLDELARQLKLDDGLKQHLENTALSSQVADI